MSFSDYKSSRFIDAKIPEKTMIPGFLHSREEIETSNVNNFVFIANTNINLNPYNGPE